MQSAMRFDQSYNIANECSYLGILLLEPTLVKDVNLCNKDFYQTLNREVFHDIVSRSEPETDLTLMAERIAAANGWDHENILDYIKMLVDGTHSLLNFKAYEAIIREKSVYRMVRECADVLERGEQILEG